MSKELVVRQKIKGFMPQLKTILGSEQKVSTYASALQQLAFNKNLANCNVESVLQAGFEIVRAGLNPNPLFGQAYVVPYGKNAQLQIGYKGWIALGYRHGWKFRAVAVYNCDKFSYEFGGLTDKYNFVPNWEERQEENGEWVYKNLKGVIVYAEDSKGNAFTNFVSKGKLEKIRLKSQNQKDGGLQHIWLEWAEEMYKAKALKYVITRLPIQEEILEAAGKEDAEIITEAEQPKQTTKNPLDMLKQEGIKEAEIEEKPTEQELLEKLKEYAKTADKDTKTKIMNAVVYNGLDKYEVLYKLCQELELC